MKWFFALNEDAGNFEPIAQMIKVAVYSARRHTSLEPHFLYDGKSNHLTQWLETRGVTIIPCRSYLYPHLEDLARRGNKPHILTVGAGAFLRTEIPRLAQEKGLSDTYILYTDCDVIFQNEVSDLDGLQPKFFAVAPEGDRKDYTRINTGAMLMNLPALRAKEAVFRPFMLRHLDKLTAASWDQTAYEWFYNPLMRRLLESGQSAANAERIYRGLQRRGLPLRLGWQKLPSEFNWKPYWGQNPQARIIHFHGAKPFERDIMAPGKTPEHLQHLKASATGAYFEMSELWDDLLAEAERGTETAVIAAQ